MKPSKNLVVFFFLLIFCFSISGFSPVLADAGDVDIRGIWKGALSIQGMELTVVVHIAVDSAGALTATMDSPDQGATGIPVSGIRFEGDSLHLEVASVNGTYEAKFLADSLAFDGIWSQGGFELPLKLKKVDKLPERKRPQNPEKPYPYDDEEVAYRNENAAIELAGTLTTPRGDGPFPAVIIISGSGAQDRDGTVFSHKPYLVLADYLTRRGIAVLRVDDRGVGGSGGKTSQSTSQDFAGDVLAGINFLKTHPKITSSNIGLIGHSEGGIVAPMVAAKSKDVAFIVLMAGTGLTGEEILYKQAALIFKANGATEQAIAENRAQQEKLFAILKSEKDDSLAARKLKAVIEKSFENMTEEQREQAGNIEKMVDMQVAQINNPWFRFFLIYDPKTALRNVTCPVLAINGSKDLQVPPEENLQAIEQALRAGGNTNVTIKELPDLNHMFQTCMTGSPNEYSKIEETIAPAALQLIGDWILKISK